MSLAHKIVLVDCRIGYPTTEKVIAEVRDYRAAEEVARVLRRLYVGIIVVEDNCPGQRPVQQPRRMRSPARSKES